MAKLYNKLTQIMGHAFSFNFTLCNFSLVPSLFFTREAKIGLAQDYCTPQEQECYKFVMPRSDLGRVLGMKLKFDLPVPAYIAFKHGRHTYLHVSMSMYFKYRTRPSLVVFPNQLILFPWLYVSIYIRVWGVEGEKWMCKTVLTDGHQRTIRSG